jgi:hypothetical protein
MPKTFLPNLLPHKEMKFAPVEEDDDELSEFIKNDPLAHDNQWDLHESVDPKQLEAFWSDAVKELGAFEAETESDK